jgi:hypothetical protein
MQEPVTFIFRSQPAGCIKAQTAAKSGQRPPLKMLLLTALLYQDLIQNWFMQDAAPKTTPVPGYTNQLTEAEHGSKKYAVFLSTREFLSSKSSLILQ